jgi:trehalose 6-phosphate synthase/phosphatase
MDPAEKAARHAKLYKVVTTHTSHTWAAVLVKMLLGQLGLQGMARQTPYIPKEKLERLYLKAKKKLFLFDYDVCHSSIHLAFFFLSTDSLLFSGNTVSDR